MRSRNALGFGKTQFESVCVLELTKLRLDYLGLFPGLLLL